jgi:hypothetical protein
MGISCVLDRIACFAKQLNYQLVDLPTILVITPILGSIHGYCPVT